MEPAATVDKAEVSVLGGLKINTLDPLEIPDDLSIYEKVKEEAGDETELSPEFKAEPDESAEEIELGCVPWVKREYEEWHKMRVKQEWAETHNEATLRRKFGCKRKPVVRIERLILDKSSLCRSPYFEGRKQLFKQSQRLDPAELCRDAAGASRGTLLRTPSVPFTDGRNSQAWREVRQDSYESGLKAAANTDSTLSAKSCGTWLAAGVHLDIHSIDCQQKSCTQTSNEAETATVNDDQESTGTPALGYMKYQVDGASCPLLTVKGDKSIFLEHQHQNTEILNGLVNNTSSKPHPDKKLFECCSCGRKFSQKSYLKIHRRIHTGEKPFECSECRKKFIRKSLLIRHMRVHTGEKPYECSICRKKFTIKSSLNSHIRIHTGENVFKCNVCRKNFVKESLLIKHARSHTGEKPFECSVCRRKFTRNSSLTLHFKIHTAENPFECSECKSKFTQKSSLISHMRIHTGEKPFECSECKKKFTLKSRLILHITNHTGEKPHECSVCRKKFTRRSDLNKHIRIHTGEKPFECSVCHRKFTQKSDLNTHTKLHTGEKPFECSECRKKFAYRSVLKTHFCIHTGEKPFECSVCRKKFTRKSDLTKHTHRKH